MKMGKGPRVIIKGIPHGKQSAAKKNHKDTASS
jgi:hypothetical protein